MSNAWHHRCSVFDFNQLSDQSKLFLSSREIEIAEYDAEKDFHDDDFGMIP